MSAAPARPAAPPVRPPLPADRPRAFAEEAGRLLGTALVACEERFPREGTHSVLFVVVEGPAAVHRPRLEALHAELCADLEPAAPVRLEVLDRATHEALDRLIAAGLIAPVCRAARPLHPAAPAPAPLSPEELARAKAHRDLAVRRLKMARLLVEGGLVEESRPPLLEAMLALARALAAESRLPEPASLEEALRPPLVGAFGPHAGVLQACVSQPAANGRAALEAVAAMLAAR